MTAREDARPPPPGASAGRRQGHRVRHGLLRALTLAFFAAVAAFGVRYALTVDWPGVGRAITAMPPSVLLQAAALAAASHALYSCFDLLGRHYTRHRLPVRQVMAVNFISYAFNLNMGSLVGGVAFRLRLYARLGLAPAVITRVMTLSMLTNWLGYFVLGGAVFLAAPLPLPAGWTLGTPGLQALGGGMLALAAGWLWLCLRARRREFSVRGHEVVLPPARMAALQVVMSCANWALMGALVTVLLQGRLPYATVLAVLLVAAVAGVLTHVPAGLGVLEAVFVTLLAHRVPATQLLGALLVYRALYYLVPWGLATGLYLWMESRARPPGPGGRQGGRRQPERLRSPRFACWPRPPHTHP